MTQWAKGTSAFLRQTKQVGHGISLFAELVKPTLGPKGRSVTVSTPDGQPTNTKHGMLIAESMNWADPWEAKGVAMIKAAAKQTGDFGDGASLIAVLTQSMLENADRAAAQGFNLGEITRGIDEAIKAALREIKKLARNVSSAEQIVSVGTTLAGGDANVGTVVGQVFTENPYIITVDDPRGGFSILYDRPFHFHGIQQPGTFARERLQQIQRRSFLTIDKPDDRTIVVRVGGRTEVDRSERLWAVKSTLEATLAALKGGFIPGGGAALFHASEALTKIHAPNAARQMGIEIVCTALGAPLRQIVDNAGVDSATVVNSLTRRGDAKVGYDVQTERYANMIDAGIIDPLTVVTKAVEGAGSIASAIVGAPAMRTRGAELSRKKVRNPYLRYMLPGSSFLKSEAAFERAVEDFTLGYAGEGASGKAAAPLRSGDDNTGHAASGEGQTSTTEQDRFLVGEFPERVSVDEIRILNVFVSPHEGPHSGPLGVKVPEGGLNIEIFVDVDGFELASPARATLWVPEKGDSGIVGFKLKATEAETHTIHISALANGATVAGLSFDVQVGGSVDVPPTPRSERSAMDTASSQDGDVSLILQQDPNTHKYTFTWQDNNGTRDPVYHDTPFQELNAFVAKKINEVQDVVREKYDLTPALARKKLKDFGVFCWQQLVPQQIRDWYIQDHDKIKRISVISAGDPIPWEALYPFRPNPKFDEGFLIEQVKICRWRFGPLAPGAISICRADFVFPNDALEGAATEVDQVIDLLQHCYALKGERIANQDLLFDLFDTASASLLHFACHNSFEKGGLIAVAPSSIKPDDFIQYEGQLKASAPLIFVNACRTDGKEAQYTGLGGWAKAFLSVGAGAFIGTHWEVRDKSAQCFAETLYRALVEERKCFGDALDCARDAIKKPGDPTWLAYTFYGNHRALVKKSASPAKATVKPESTSDSTSS